MEWEKRGVEQWWGVQAGEGGGRSGWGFRSARVGVAAPNRAAATVCDFIGGVEKRKTKWRRWGPKENAEKSRHFNGRLRLTDPDAGCS